jgi:hypothetical protein
MFMKIYGKKKELFVFVMKIKKKKKYLVKFDEVFDEILDYNEEKKVFHISHIYDLFVLENKKSFVQNKMNRNKKKQQQPV